LQYGDKNCFNKIVKDTQKMYSFKEDPSPKHLKKDLAENGPV